MSLLFRRHFAKKQNDQIVVFGLWLGICCSSKGQRGFFRTSDFHNFGKIFFVPFLHCNTFDNFLEMIAPRWSPESGAVYSDPYPLAPCLFAKRACDHLREMTKVFIKFMQFHFADLILLRQFNLMWVVIAPFGKNTVDSG